MSEEAFRRDVLLPLFRRMGYQDVDEYHGGTGEKGKDIVMWRPDELTGRRNFAVVAKAGRISGAVSGQSSAATTVIQIQQAFGSHYADPRSGEPQSIHEVLVLASGEIKKEAREAIVAALVPDTLKRAVTFHDGARVYELVRLHLAEATIVPDLAEIGSKLDNLSDKFSVSATTGGSGVSFTLHVKPGAEVSDDDRLVAGTVSMSIPDTEAGRSIQAALDRHFRHGEAVKIPGEFIALVKLPEPLEKLLGNDSFTPEMVALGPRRPEKGFLMTLTIRTPEGPRLFPGLPMTVERVGTDGIVFVTDPKYSSWKLRLELDHTTMEMGFSIGIGEPSVSAVEIAAIVYLHEALSLGGELEIAHASSALPFIKGNVRSGVYPAPEPIWTGFVRRMALLQRRAQQWISVPTGEIGPEDVGNALEIATIVETGAVPLQSGRVECGMPISNARVALAKQREGAFEAMYLKGVQSRLLFGVPIDLGSFTSVFSRMVLTDESVARIESTPPDAPEDTLITVEFRLAPGFSGTAYYDRWMKSPASPLTA
jgi:hypothetical protein